MKKQKLIRITVLAIMLVAVVLLAACGTKAQTTEDSLQEYLDKNGLTQEDLDAMTAAKKAEEASPSPANAASAETIPPVATASPVTAQPTAEPTPTAAPTPKPTSTPYVYVVKDPTSESVKTGGSAMFIAYADYATAITWYLISPDGNTMILASDASNYFGSVRASGMGTDTLTLSNIPLSMNNWHIQCAFSGYGGPAYTNMCSLYVSAPDPTPAPTPKPTPAPSTDYASVCDSLAWDSVYEVGSRTQGYGWHMGTRTDYYYDSSTHRADYNVTATYVDMDITFYFRADANNDTYWPTGFEVWRIVDDVYQPIERHTFKDTWNITGCWADFDEAVQYVTNMYCW